MRLDARDRRQAPRRAEEVALSVAEMSLMAAALKLAAAYRRGVSEPALLAQLERSATFYLACEMEAVAARQVVVS